MLFKISIYNVNVTEYPGASWRGQDKKQVYTGAIDRRGKKEWEGSTHWFETKAEAVAALRSYFATQVVNYQSRYNEAKANLEKANNL